MKRIPLTRGKHAIVSDQDYHYLMQWKWCYDGTYAVRRVGHRGPAILMHREVAKRMRLTVTHGIDHRKGNPLDNRRAKLRAANQSQNMANRGKPRNNTSGYKGVTRYKRYGKWQAQITVKKRNHHLGYYTNKRTAARAYNAAARKHFGKFAYLNDV